MFCCKENMDTIDFLWQRKPLFAKLPVRSDPVVNSVVKTHSIGVLQKVYQAIKTS